MTDIDDLIAQARLPERTVPICVRGDLIAELEELDRQYAAVPEAGNDVRLTSGAERRRIAEQAAAVKEQMAAATIVFRLRAKDSHDWDDLLKAHPPREGNAEDTANGYNVDTFPDALIKASAVEPELTDERWAALRPKLAPVEYSRLGHAALNLNMKSVNVPFSRAASQMIQTSEPG